MAKKILQSLVLGATLAITGCSYPSLEKKADLTGDGIDDVVVNIKYGGNSGSYLFIGQKDGSFVRAKKCSEGNTTWYRTDDGKSYFFDGKNYVEAVKEDENIKNKEKA